MSITRASDLRAKQPTTNVSDPMATSPQNQTAQTDPDGEGGITIVNADEVEQTRQRFLALDEDVQDNLLRLLHEEFPQRAEVITDEETLHAFEATYVRTRMDEEDLKKELDDDLMRLRANLAPYQRIEAEGCEAWSMNIKKPTTAERLMVGVSEAAAATMTALDECRKPACAIKAEGQANFPGEASTEQEGME